MKRFEMTIWGARGSIPAPAEPNVCFGSDTSCVELRCGDRVVVLDAGTGIVGCGRRLYEERIHDIDILLTHCHFDHIIGLPFVIPLYKDHVSARIFAGHLEGDATCQEMVEGFMCPPYFPVKPKQFAARIDYRDFRPPDVLDLGGGIAARTVRLNHPNGAVGYRIDFDGRSLCYITDTEHEPGKRDEAILDLIAGADVMIYDTTYTDEDFARYIGYGHSTWQEGVRLCRAGEVPRLILFHHDIMQTDERLTALEATARAEFAGAMVARTGLTLTVGEGGAPI
ncbi:MBL fold metallo-hydrolase [Aurantimonas sp. VKM B-3413]|uniref:MBL fold metallo-hydrolase n=1 Tax=Aurantimonas sp. VKM B-3413 TaxID=2779401 RepID=UPI001E5868E9|nr:MBL fold metallo-hydrolase [Aurantimonas sp. VKM B-3413]MCB8836726.1 MBL fold metallo-hydrolase [Aurantimonas sp. VKM B-3413]